VCPFSLGGGQLKNFLHEFKYLGVYLVTTRHFKTDVTLNYCMNRTVHKIFGVNSIECLKDIRNFVGLCDVIKLIEGRRSKFINRLLDELFDGLIFGHTYVHVIVHPL